MNAVNLNSSGVNDGFDLIRAIRLLWDYKYHIVACVGIFVTVAVVLALTATPIYRAEAIVTPVQEQDMSAAGGLLNQFSSFANLAGVTLPNAAASQEARGLLRSRRLVEEFIRRYDLLPVLSGDSEEPPSLWLAVRDFREGTLRIVEDTRRGTTTVQVDWKDPGMAADWANQYVALANEFIRARARDEASRNIAYLNEQIAATNVVELQRVMFSLIESETKTLMLANARAEYAFTIIDPAVAPETRISPRRRLMVMTGAALGFFAGVVMALGFDVLRRYRAGTLRRGWPGSAS